MPERTLVIANPKSASGATGRRWDHIERSLRAALGDLGVERTRGPRDAERIAREAVRAGVERLIVAGGDGTTGEVVSGLLAAGLGAHAQVGVLPLGTGSDLGRSLALPRDLDAALALLAEGRTRAVDAGRIEYEGRDGTRRTSYFLNVTSFGISGLVDELVVRAPRALGGTFAFLVASLQAIARYRSSPVEIDVDGQRIHEGPLVLGVAANGAYFGSGMHVAPQARIDDAHLDVVVVGGLSKLGLLANMPSIYRGTHLSNPAVSRARGRRVEARATAGEVWLDVDGEPLGTLPAAIELLPEAVQLFGVPPS